MHKCEIIIFFNVKRHSSIYAFNPVLSCVAELEWIILSWIIILSVKVSGQG